MISSLRKTAGSDRHVRVDGSGWTSDERWKRGRTINRDELPRQVVHSSRGRCHRTDLSDRGYEQTGPTGAGRRARPLPDRMSGTRRPAGGFGPGARPLRLSDRRLQHRGGRLSFGEARWTGGCQQRRAHRGRHRVCGAHAGELRPVDLASAADGICARGHESIPVRTADRLDVRGDRGRVRRGVCRRTAAVAPGHRRTRKDSAADR